MTTSTPYSLTELGSAIAVINRCAPYAGSKAQESLEFVMAMSNFGQLLSVFFMGDGVYQLVNNQTPQHIARKHFTKGLAALPFYDVDNIFVCQQSLEQRGMHAEQLSLEVHVVAPEEFAGLLGAHKQVVTF